jgi:hypothetical protein
MRGSEKAWALCSIVLLGLLAALSYHAFVAWVLDAGYPSNTFLFRPEFHFSDFYDIFRPVQKGSPLGTQAAVYFPFAYVPLYPLIWMTPQAALATTLAVFCAGTFYFVWLKLDFLSPARRGIAAAILTFASYPFLFAVTRGNLEMIVLLFLLGFIMLVERGRYLAAAALLACATAMKLYPGVYGVLLLQRRQYKASALTAALTLILSLLAASAFPGGIAGTAQRLLGNLDFFKEEYILSAGTIYFSSSYFSVLKLLVRIAGYDVPLVLEALRLPYAILSIAAFAAITLFIFRIERTLWKQACLLCFAMILLPEVSFDYRLAHILLPLGLFIAAPPGNARHDRLYAALFGLLLIPKAYAPIGFEVTLGVVLNPLLMTLMSGHILWTGWLAGGERKQAAQGFEAPLTPNSL